MRLGRYMRCWVAEFAGKQSLFSLILARVRRFAEAGHEDSLCSQKGSTERSIGLIAP